MTTRNVQYMSNRQWVEHREAELARLRSMQAAAEVAGLVLQPGAPDGARCDVCFGAIVAGCCTTCDSVFIDGIRVPGVSGPLPFDAIAAEDRTE